MPLPLIAAAGIAAAGSIAGALINKKGAEATMSNNERLMRMQYDYSDRAANIAYERQRTMRDEANIYNDPTHQMERLEAAGLNPYLVYSNGGSTLESASPSVPQASTPSQVAQPNYYAGIGDSVSNTFNTALANAMAIIKLRNETKLAEANVSSIEANTQGQELTNSYDAATMSSRMALAEAQSALTSAQVSKTEQDTAIGKIDAVLKEAQTDVQKQQALKTTYEVTAQAMLNKWLDKRQTYELAQIMANTKLAVRQGRLLDIQMGLAKFEAETRRLSANASMISANKMSWDQALVQMFRYIFGDSDSIASKIVNEVKNRAASLLPGHK